MKRRPVVLFAYGSGGHSTAMHRLIQKLTLNDIPKIQLIEKDAIPLSGMDTFWVRRIMPKRDHYWRKFLVPVGAVSNFIASLRIFFTYDVKIVITTGPAIAIFPAIFAKLNGKAIVFIESWCRFESVSITGRILDFMGATVYYQNYEIAHLLPRGKYSGRL